MPLERTRFKGSSEFRASKGAWGEPVRIDNKTAEMEADNAPAALAIAEATTRYFTPLDTRVDPFGSRIKIITSSYNK